MPAPLIWLGAACVGLYASNKANTAYLKHKYIIDAMPGETNHMVKPINGSIVTCGIYGVLDHTGIWIDGNIYELSGQGLIRCLSPDRFLGDRTGSTIYVACDTFNKALASQHVCDIAQSKLYTLLDYHLLEQNCHKFVADLYAGYEVNVTSFSDLNTFLSQHFSTPIRWNLTHIK
jgi:hypothetical protein